MPASFQICQSVLVTEIFFCLWARTHKYIPNLSMGTVRPHSVDFHIGAICEFELLIDVQPCGSY